MGYLLLACEDGHLIVRVTRSGEAFEAGKTHNTIKHARDSFRILPMRVRREGEDRPQDRKKVRMGEGPAAKLSAGAPTQEVRVRERSLEGRKDQG